MDTGIFITVSFWGTVPAGVLVNMMLSQYVIKLVIAVCDTPFCYLLVSLLRERVKQTPLVDART